jgi:hypothetical protein
MNMSDTTLKLIFRVLAKFIEKKLNGGVSPLTQIPQP